MLILPHSNTKSDSLLDMVKETDLRLNFTDALKSPAAHESLDRAGLRHVIEQWNGTNDFVFCARRGELASDRHEDHELSMPLRSEQLLHEIKFDAWRIQLFSVGLATAAYSVLALLRNPA
jgi:hypothetical protein